MKKIVLIFISTFHFVSFGQVIQNGGFEDGPRINGFSQITRATHWVNGCEFGTDLYDCQAEPIPSGPAAGTIVNQPPVEGCLYPRNNGDDNCRFGSLRTTGFNSSHTSVLSAGHLRNELTSNLLPDVTYTLQLWVARLEQDEVPPTRRIEAVLRPTTDGDICDFEIIVPITTDIGFTNCDWVLLSTTFQLTTTQALGGWDWIEFREIPRTGYLQERIYIDDVVLSGGIDDLGTDEISENESFNIYPNPASSELHIDTKTSFEKVIVTDLLGNIVLETYGSNIISVESLSAGVYIVQIDDLYSQRFVKN